MALPVINYPQKYVFVETGTAIPTLTPSSTGGAVTSWSIDNTLPTGLSFNTSTGVISGTPSVAGVSVTFGITATNASGTDFDYVTIHVISSGLPKYYISSSGLTGNTGTSKSSPWPASKISTITSGYILLKKGDTFSSTTINITNSGTSGSPIVLDVYGTSTNNPVIDGNAANSAVIQVSGNYIVVNNLVLQNNTYVNGVCYISSSAHDVTINNCYVNNGKRGIYSLNSGSVGGVANIKIIGNYLQNISDATHAGGSPLQFNNTNGSGIFIGQNQSYVDMSLPDASRTGIGDIINLYQCNGVSSSYIVVYNNLVRGGSSYSGGEAGLILGDVGGSYQKAYKNYLFNSGFAQMQIQGGTFIDASYNYMYSAQWSYNMQAISFANYSGTACNNITCGNNKTNNIDKNGVAYSWFIDNSGNSTSTGVSGGAALATPTGWSTNTPQLSADSSVTSTLIPDPLWSGSPWNTATTALSFGALPTKTVGDADFAPGAVSSDPITYTSSNTSVATIVSNNIHIIAAGSSNITADDTNNQITQPFTVNAVAGAYKVISRKFIPI